MIFTRKDLRPEGFFGGLFGPNKTNALIELNNALANAASVRQITFDTIEQLNTKYRTDIHKKFRMELSEMHRSFLRACLCDRVFSDDEVADVWHLKSLFGISDADHEKLYQEEAIETYEQELATMLKDSKLTDAEKEGLERLSAYLRIPEELKKQAFDRIAEPFVEKKAAQMTADNQVSPEEEAELNALCRSLGVTLKLDHSSQIALQQMRLLWRINNGELQPLSVPINLQRGEECYHCVDADWYEHRRVTRRVSYGGPSLRIKIMKGVYWNTGSYGVHRHSEDVLTQIDSGKLYLTNKRLLFDGVTRNYSIRFNKILDVIPYSDGIGIEKDAGKSPVLLINGAGTIMTCTALLARLIRDYAA